MSKLIKMTPEYMAEVRRDFEEALSSGRFADGQINFTKTFSSIERKATIFFTELAWLKMQTLIREFDKEVAWHGIAKRGKDETKDEYYITDILVYPQEVTGATVNTDQEKYQTWLFDHEDDVFNNIRMQGHSHVNMGTSPSGVDTSLYERILEQLDNDMFYIFMIWNKRKEKTIKIYDLSKNVLFETSDVTVKILDDGTGIEKFLKNAKEMVKDKPTVPLCKGIDGYTGYSGDWYRYDGYYNNHQTDKYSEKEEPKVPVTQSSKKRKGKRVGKKDSLNNACQKQTRLSLYTDDDDDDTMNDPFHHIGW